MTSPPTHGIPKGWVYPAPLGLHSNNNLSAVRKIVVLPLETNRAEMYNLDNISNHVTRARRNRSRGKMSQAVTSRNVALLTFPSECAQQTIEGDFQEQACTRKLAPEDRFRYESDLFSSCSCTQAKRVRAEITSENSYRKRYWSKMTTKKTPTLRFVAASLI